jgi:hypothetical protein
MIKVGGNRRDQAEDQDKRNNGQIGHREGVVHWVLQSLLVVSAAWSFEKLLARAARRIQLYDEREGEGKLARIAQSGGIPNSKGENKLRALPR